MVEVYGMGEKMLPHENDVLLILENAQKEIEHFLEGMSKALSAISDELLEKESITKSRIKEIMDEIL